jgi:endonuclease/exonuclease/phosphatase family metal-dependent hydrolase
MRIIFLNIWNAKRTESLTDFIREQDALTDVFCFQVVFSESQTTVDGLLPDFQSFISHKVISEEQYFAQATYVHKRLPTSSSERILDDVPRGGIGLYTEIGGTECVHVCNVHGIAYKRDDKLDDPVRLAQSRGLIDFFRPRDGQKIIGGDFNVLNHVESIRMFEQHGYVDLIERFNIPTTRNRLAWENYPGNEMRYSDYVFVSPDVKVKNFTVIENEVSDHLPMILEIEDDIVLT